MNQRNTKIKALLICGAMACPLLVLVFLIEGAIRPGYNPLRYPISSLSIGDSGWIQVVSFLITGSLLLAFAFGLRSSLHSSKGPRLIGLVAVGLIGAGIFSTDAIYGYPEDQPLRIAQYSIHGHLHDLFSIVVFACLPAACFVFRKQFLATGKRGWAIYSSVTGISMIMTFVLAAMGFKQLPGFEEYAGVFQRLCISIGWAWMTLLALHFLRPGAPHPI